MFDDVIANTEIATLDALDPTRLAELRAKVVAADLASDLGKSKWLSDFLAKHDHRTSSYIRRRMLDELAAQSIVGQQDAAWGVFVPTVEQR